MGHQRSRKSGSLLSPEEHTHHDSEAFLLPNRGFLFTRAIYPVSRGEDLANLQIGKVGTVLNTALLLFGLACRCQIVLYLFEITKLTVLT